MIGAFPTPSAFGHGPEPVPGEAAWDRSFVPPRAMQDEITGPSVLVALNFARFRPGERFALGLDVQNPSGSAAAADLVVGVLLPDGQTLAVVSGGGGVSTLGTSPRRRSP